MVRRRKYWGWGYEDEQPSPAELRSTAAFLATHIGFGSSEPEVPKPLGEVELPPPRLKPPPALRDLCSDDPYDRASHALGKAYRDIVRGLRGGFANPPDQVSYPGTEQEIEAVLEWCEKAGAAAIPFGGGTSAVAGVEPRIDARYNGAVTIDLRRLDRVLDVDEASRAALVQAGATGPALEAQLREHGLTLRHFPQSFELSTLGGWIATRAAGHYATLITHIDDLVESVRAVTPAGVWQSRRLPGSGAGISPDRMLIGSEGAFGIITEAWVRFQVPPRHRRSTAVRFRSFADGLEAVRNLSQTWLHPANCRLVDAREAALTGSGDGEHAILLLGFESPAFPVDEPFDRALSLCRDHGGAGADGSGSGRGASGGSVGSWREAFLRAPYLRDTLVAMGVITETFETAITWDRAERFHATITAEVQEALAEVCGDGFVTCRITHVYPDGPALYFTVLAPGRQGEEIDQWDEIKRRASDAVIEGGGTITHHHAVGRDHRPWYDRQRPEPFAGAICAAKRSVDPHAIMNPGVLIDPEPV